MILDNFPLILWINLDRSLDRKAYMEKLLDEYGLKNIRISALDGGKNDFKDKVVLNPNITNLETGCTASHLKAMKYFIEETDEEEIVICEDDISWEFLRYIPFNWSEAKKLFPTDYNIVKLSTNMLEENKYFVKISHNTGIYSSGGYLITRKMAEEFVNKYYSKETDKYDFSSLQRWQAVADCMIISVPNVYAFPILTYVVNGSIIHPSHVGIHCAVKNKLKKSWEKFTQNKEEALKIFNI